MLGESCAVQYLHDHERHSTLRPDVEDVHDVGVMNLCSGPGFAEEPSRSARLRGERGIDELQSDAFAQDLVRRLVNGTIPPSPSSRTIT